MTGGINFCNDCCGFSVLLLIPTLSSVTSAKLKLEHDLEREENCRYIGCSKNSLIEFVWSRLSDDDVRLSELVDSSQVESAITSKSLAVPL